MSFGICWAYDKNGYYRTQWLCNVCAFQPDFAYERGLDEMTPNPYGILPCNSIDDIDPSLELVVLSPLATAREVVPTVSLNDFVHPANACYYFGADFVWMSEEELGARPRTVVYVPNLSPDPADELYSFVVGAIVLRDRQVKMGV